MTDEQMIALLSYYHDFMVVGDKQFPPESFDVSSGSIDCDSIPPHLAWMCSESIKFVQEGHIEKAHRWLGFIQGVLWKEEAFTLNDLREHVINASKDRHPDYAR